MERTLTFSPASAVFCKPAAPPLRPRPAPRAVAPRRHGPGIALAVALVAVAVAAVLALGARSPKGRAAQPATEAATAAVFTGEFVGDVPVYRLPPVHVVASRSVELARIAGEDAGGTSAARP